MLPDPLHPAVVHLPIALALLIPLLAALAALSIQRSWLPARLWLAVVLLQALLIGGGLFAEETGEHEQGRVEKAVDEQLIDEHEEAAERFVWLAGAALLVSGLGLLQGQRGEIARWASVAVSLGVLAAAGAAGHLGGELVYKHGAASAYVDGSAGAADDHAAHHHDED
jgi:uncharacterized membrane protein